MTQKKFGIQAKFIAIISAILLVVLVSFWFSIHKFVRDELVKYGVTSDIREAKGKFMAMQRGDTNMMSATLESLLRDREVLDALEKKDRSKMLASSEDFFQNVKSNFGITHFYFISPEGEVLLRVHKPEQFGDKLQRVTFLQAQQSQKIGSGLELGATAFALRVVKPAYKDGKLIGYLELGQEISHFINSLLVSQADDFALLVDKGAIKHEQWQTMRQNNNLRDNWDDFRDYLEIDSTVNDDRGRAILKACFKPEIFEKAFQSESEKSFGDYSWGQDYFACGSFPVFDANGQNAGLVIAIKNIDEINNLANWIVISLIGVIIVLILLAASSLIFFVRRTIVKPMIRLESIAKKVAGGDFSVRADVNSTDEIGEFSRAFNKTVEELSELYESLENKVSQRTIELEGKSVRLEQTKRAMLNLLKDVQEEKENISKERARYATLLQGIGDGIIATDKAGNITYLNQASAQLLKINTNEALDKNIAQLVGIEDKNGQIVPPAKRPISLALQQQKSISLQNFYILKDGTKFPVALTVSPVIVDGQTIGAIEVFHDMTKEWEVDKAKTEFVSLASHQLRTPLSAINWYSEMLLAGDTGKLKKDQEKYIKEIFDSNQRMIQLVNALLNTSRIEMGTMAITPEIVDIPEIAKSVLGEIDAQIKQKNLELTQEYDPAVPKINADAKLVRIILQNLLTNAVKYTPAGGKVALALTKDSKNFIIKVVDNGYGIPEKDKTKIFNKLYRADNVREKETDGTGLGLYLVKAIVEQAGGKVWFDSVENQGTTFNVTIPLSGMIKKQGTKQLS